MNENEEIPLKADAPAKNTRADVVSVDAVPLAPEKRINTIGERWITRVNQMVQRRFTSQKWQRTADAIQQRNSSPRAQLQSVVQAEPDAPTILEPVANRPSETTQGPFPKPAWEANARQPQSPIDNEPLALTTLRRPPQAYADARGSLSSPTRLTTRSTGADDVAADSWRTHSRQPTPAEPAPGTAATAPPPLPPTVRQTIPTRVEHRVTRYLERVLDMRIPAVQVYANQAADEVTRQFGADAVTFDDAIFFRTDKYNPATPEGVGLLAHEITHAAAVHTARNSVANEATDQEELTALQNEQRVRHAAQIASPEAFAPMATPTVTVSHSPAPAPQPTGALPVDAPAPRTALADRNDGASAPSAMSGGGQISERELSRIKEEVYRYLMTKITTEFERGA